MSQNIQTLLITVCEGGDPALVNNVIPKLFPRPSNFNPKDPSTAPKKVTLGQQFRTQLNDLMQTL